MSTAATGHLHGLFTDVHVLYWDTHGFIFHECSKKLLEMKNSKSFFLKHLLHLWSFRKGKIYTIFAPGGCRSSYWAPGGYTETPGCIRMYTVATRILPNVYGGYTEIPGCIRWLHGDSRMYTVAIRRFPDVYGSYTEVHGAYKEWYGSFFIRVLRDEKLCGV